MLDKVPIQRDSQIELPRTPPQQQQDLDFTLLGSSPPIGTELRVANNVFNSAVQTSDLSTPVKRYARRLASLTESTSTQLTTLKRTVEQQEQLLSTRKKRSKGKRVKVDGKFVFTTEEVYKYICDAEAEVSAKKVKKTTKKTVTVEISSGSESPASAISETISLLSEIVVAME